MARTKQAAVAEVPENAETVARLEALVKKLEVRVRQMEAPFSLLVPDWGWAKRDMVYCGESVSRGQVMRLGKGKNDEKLYRLRYILDLPSGFDVERDSVECGLCGAKFIKPGYRDAHGLAVHENTCEYCGERFTWEKELRRHRRECDMYQKERAEWRMQAAERALGLEGYPGEG